MTDHYLFCMYYGPEYVSGKLIAWAEQNNTRMEYIQPGKPEQNAYIERFNRTVRYNDQVAIKRTACGDDFSVTLDG